jgi:hypothetical protein
MTLEDAIRQSVDLGQPNASGFYAVKCKVCDDYKVRGGFKFESDGKIVYNCFRGKCDATSVYNPEEPITYKFKQVLKAFGVDIPTDIKLQQRQSRKPFTYDKELYQPHQYVNVELPTKHMVAYDPAKHSKVKAFLSERGLEDDVDYYIGISGKWANRLITPCRLNDVLIGWESRSLISDDKFFEKSAFNTDMMWFPDGIIPNEPILVEGIFDAKSIPNGVALMHSTISEKQAYFLRNKHPILLPDRKGSRFLSIAKKYGWPMIIPTYKEKDANAAMLAIGRLVLAEILRDNIHKNYNTIELRYNLWAERTIRTKNYGKNSRTR